MSDKVASKSAVKKVMAKDLIDFIVSRKPKAEVENDEALYVKPRGEIEVDDDDGLCSLVVRMDLGESLDMGNFLVEIGGVEITVSRSLDGPEDDYEFDGAEIVYDDGLTKDDIVAAIKANVEFPPYDAMQYNDTDFDLDDVEESVSVDDCDFFAVDEDGSVYCYSDEDDVPDDQDVIPSSEAIHRLVEEWSDNGGDVDGTPIDSFGPWS